MSNNILKANIKSRDRQYMHIFLCKKSISVRAIPSKKGKAGSGVLKMFLYGGLKIFKNISVGGSQIQ